MKLVSVREFRANPSRSLAESRASVDVVLTNNGKPVALLWPVAEDNLEESLKMARRARAERAMHSMRMRAAETGRDKLTMDDIDAVIAEVRAGRRRAKRKSGR